MAEENVERVAAKTVDLSDTSLPEGAKSKLDPNQDAWEYPAPIPRGVYNLRLHLGDAGFKSYQTDEDNPDTVVYSANLECKVESDDKDANGATVFERVNTRIGRGKDISTMAALLVLCGAKIEKGKETTPLKVARALDKLLKKDPTPLIKGCLLDWRGARQLADGSWEDVFRSMVDFPKDSQGRYQHTVAVSKQGGGKDEVRARLFVKKWPVGGKVAEVVEEAPSNVVSAASVLIEDENELTL